MANYLEVVMQATSASDPIGAKPIANVYHFRRIAGAVAPSKANINTAFQNDIGAKVLLAMNEDYLQTFNVIRFFDEATDLPVAFVQAGVGSLTGQRLPDYVTASVRMKAAVRSRSGRGRKSYSPLDEDSSTGDALTAGAITLFTDICTAILAGFTDADGNTWKPVIKSGKPPADYTTDPVVVVTYDVVQCSVNQALGLLKRRKVRV